MRIKHGSDTFPETIIKSAGKTHVRYDIEESEFEEMDGTKRACYDFSYIAIEGELTRAKIIDAIIADEIGGKDAEIALINNELASPGTPEYAVYQELRNHAKDVADMVLGH